METFDSLYKPVKEFVDEFNSLTLNVGVTLSQFQAQLSLMEGVQFSALYTHLSTTVKDIEEIGGLVPSRYFEQAIAERKAGFVSMTVRELRDRREQFVEIWTDFELVYNGVSDNLESIKASFDHLLSVDNPDFEDLLSCLVRYLRIIDLPYYFQSFNT